MNDKHQCECGKAEGIPRTIPCLQFANPSSWDEKEMVVKLCDECFKEHKEVMRSEFSDEEFKDERIREFYNLKKYSKDETELEELVKPRSLKKTKNIIIDKNTHVQYFSEKKFEIHVSATGPLGAFVYIFEDGNLVGRQRRSYSFASKVNKVLFED